MPTLESPRLRPFALTLAVAIFGSACSATPAPDPAPGDTPTASLNTASPGGTGAVSGSATPTVVPGPSYLACGCGCCGAEDAEKRCLYHSKGDDLDKIIAADKAARKKASCKNKGCSMGVQYSYCD